MTYEVTAAGIPAVNVVTRSRVVNGVTVKPGNPAGTRREVRVSSTAANEVGGTAAGKAVAASAEVSATAAEVRAATAATAAAEVTTTSATTTAAVSATTTATVALGSGRHRRPSSDR
jgi:hypothetical protein